MPNFKTTILALLTILMLALYAGLVVSLIFQAANCHGTCEVEQRTIFAVNSVQSLVSALVISVLAISKSEHSLNLQFLGIASPQAEKVAIAYVLTWLLVGSAAFVYGQFILPEAQIKMFSILVDVGTAWFGLAIAAAYAYLGIKP